MKSVTLPGTATHIVSGFCLAIASFFPGTYHGLILAITSSTLIALSILSHQVLLAEFFVGGIAFSATAFYWVPRSFVEFGDLSRIASAVIFAAFCCASAGQFAFCGWVLRRLSGWRPNLFMFPVAWCTAECVFPRVFPWQIGHNTICCSIAASLASMLGVSSISLLVVSWGQLIAALLSQRKCPRSFGIAVLSLTLTAWVAGTAHSVRVRRVIEMAPVLRIALIQGNVAPTNHPSRMSIQDAIERYQRLSRLAVSDGAELIVWPETTTPIWNNITREVFRGSKPGPIPDGETAVLFGASTYQRRSPEHVAKLLAKHGFLRTPGAIAKLSYMRFNSSVAVDESGEEIGRYNKRVLLPLGEYIPMGDSFPFLTSFFPSCSDFTAGDSAMPIRYPRDGRNEPSIATLICYEDFFPELCRESVNRGANLIVSQSNDACFGDTFAPLQHHMLASWRAVESARYTLRVTNSGYTCIIDPLGQTLAFLPLFEEGVIVEDVPLIEFKTLYSCFGEKPARLVSWVVCCWAAVGMPIRDRMRCYTIRAAVDKS